MTLTHLRWHASLAEFEAQAEALLAGWRAEDADAERLIRTRHPAFMDPDVAWKPREMSRAQARAVPIGPEDSRAALARWYDYADWARLVAHVSAMAEHDGALARFEAAVEALVDGDLAALRRHLEQDPGMVQARSARVTCFDPPVHRATLLHYIAANGVENYHQRTPANAVDIARVLLDAGAEPDALASCYGGECTTMTLLVSSSHPAEAGVQGALVDVLVDYGGAVEPLGRGSWTSPLLTALAFGFGETAETLVRRGASIPSLSAAAGLGRLDVARQLLPDAASAERHRALALAAIGGRAEIVGLLIDTGEDPDRYNPPGHHAHSTPLHQAALAGHLEVVTTLVERGARLDIRDRIWHGMPLGWAIHGQQAAVAEYLRSKGARDD